MLTSATYFHALDGRVRIKIPQVKKSSAQASALKRMLLAVNGVTEVTTNSTTGNVLILFDSTIVKLQEILQELQRHGYLDAAFKSTMSQKSHCRECGAEVPRNAGPSRPSAEFKGYETAAHFLVQTAIEAGLKALVQALI